MRSLILRVALAVSIFLVASTMGAMPVAQARTIHAIQEHEAMNTTARTAPSVAQGPVTILDLDMSGSMSGNDPNRVRCAAANTYISLSHPGEYIGLVGLVNRQGEPDGTAEMWSKPIEMTYNGRQRLQQIIASKCSPNGNTPTYDSLNLAYQQLSSTIKNGQAKGTVVMLTDGQPQPDPEGQINKIENELVPLFQKKEWHIDTVAIGTTETDFSFLKTISQDTDGKNYDESQGRVANALQLMPLFVDIFQHEVGRTPGPDVQSTSLTDGTVTKEFIVNPYADDFDVIVAYDTPGTTVTLKDPQGNAVSALPIVSSGDAPQYAAVYSVPSPVAAYNGSSLIPWTLIVSGSGSFLMDSLLTSKLQIKIQSPLPESAQPLGKTFIVSATVNNQDGSLYQGQLALVCSLTYIGGTQHGTPQPCTMIPTKGQVYQANVNIPLDQPSGIYQLDVSASQTSGDNHIAAASLRLRLDLFAYPELSSDASTFMSTDLQATVTRWPFWLQFYSLPFLQRFSSWPLQATPAQPMVSLTGRLKTVDGSLYQKNTPIDISVVQTGIKNPIPIEEHVVTDRTGRFHFAFQPSDVSDYQITLIIHGPAADSHGDLLVTNQQLHLKFQDATPAQILYAGGVTALYILFLIFYIFYLRFCFSCPPFGALQQVTYDESASPSYSFAKVKRFRLGTFFNRNILASRELTGVPDGLVFHFQHREMIRTQKLGVGKDRWQSDGGGIWRYQDGQGTTRTYSIIEKADVRQRTTGLFWGVVFGGLGLVLLAIGILFNLVSWGLVGLLLAPLGLAFALPGLLSKPNKRQKRINRDPKKKAGRLSARNKKRKRTY